MENVAARGRMILGALVGVVVVGVHIVSAVINYLTHESVRERTTEGAVAAAVVSITLFAMGGAAAGWLTTLKTRWPGYIGGGAIAGALVWSHLTATWAFTARATSLGPPSYTIPESVAIGAALGVCGGMLLLLFASLRARRA